MDLAQHQVQVFCFFFFFFFFSEESVRPRGAGRRTRWQNVTLEYQQMTIQNLIASPQGSLHKRKWFLVVEKDVGERTTYDREKWKLEPHLHVTTSRDPSSC